jgi:hypothetical protein
MLEKEEIFLKFYVLEEELIFLMGATKADDYYITITESKKFTEEDGSFILKNIKFICTKKIFLHLLKS